MARVDYTQGDYRVVAERLRPAAEALVAAAGVGPGELVLDLGAGTGNVARSCEARGSDVVAVDRVVEQLAAGSSEGGRVSWVAGDLHALPLRDGVADALLSTFAVIYADRPALAVDELRRVARPGARLGLTAWPEGGFQQESAAIITRHTGLASDHGHDHIASWGTPAAIGDRLSPVADVQEVRELALETTYASVDAWWEVASTYGPPLVTARSVLSPEQWGAMARELRAAALAHGRDGDGFVLVERYLLVLARFA